MLSIRLARLGSTHSPCYRVVVSDSRKTPRSTNSDVIGYYNPTHEPPIIEIDRARAEYWMSKGARPSQTVRSLIARAGTAAEAPVATEAS